MRWLEILKQHNDDNWQRPGVMSYRESSREKDVKAILGRLAEGRSIALISDAGTPGISDPGWYLVREARLKEVPVWPIPGACAAVAALSVVPFPTRRFHFEGFLPHSGKQRRVAVERVVGCSDTVVLYESPHRLQSTLQELAEGCPERELFVIREMTKKFEESWWGPMETAPLAWAEKTVKGEFTLVLGPLEQEMQEEVHQRVGPSSQDFSGHCASFPSLDFQEIRIRFIHQRLESENRRKQHPCLELAFHERTEC